jgi:hypothetical protein
MNWINELLLQSAVYLKPYTAQLAVALVATLLVIYGNSINRAVRLLVRPYSFIVRISVFIVLCTLGYGALTVWGASQLKVLMVTLPDVYFTPVVLVAFIILGVLAERFHKK